eukprot:scaffold8926_cov73-Skeletonema_marinoi.AAC.1
MGRSDDVNDVFGRENDSAARNNTLAALCDIIRHCLPMIYGDDEATTIRWPSSWRAKSGGSEE